MRNIAEIIEDDRKGKKISQTERQIAIAYIQGKYDAGRKLKIGNNSNNTNELLEKIRAEIWDLQYGDEEKSMTDEDRADAYNNAIIQVVKIIDKYKGSEDKE